MNLLLHELLFRMFLVNRIHHPQRLERYLAIEIRTRCIDASDYVFIKLHSHTCSSSSSTHSHTRRLAHMATRNHVKRMSIKYSEMSTRSKEKQQEFVWSALNDSVALYRKSKYCVWALTLSYTRTHSYTHSHTNTNTRTAHRTGSSVCRGTRKCETGQTQAGSSARTVLARIPKTTWTET